MTKGRNTTAVAVRLDDRVYARIKCMAEASNITVSEYLKAVLEKAEFRRIAKEH